MNSMNCSLPMVIPDSVIWVQVFWVVTPCSDVVDRIPTFQKSMLPQFRPDKVITFIFLKERIRIMIMGHNLHFK
jgi:hypothetical protein